MALTKNLVLYQGDDFELIFQLKNKGTGTPVNITGCTPKSEIRASPDAATVTKAFAATILGDPLNGTVRLYLTSANTAMLTPGEQLVWDVQLLWPGGVVKTYLAGSVNILPEVTRA